MRKRKTSRASFTRAYNGLIHELGEREPNEEIVRTQFTTSERLASVLHNLESEWYDTFSQEREDLMISNKNMRQRKSTKKRWVLAREG